MKAVKKFEISRNVWLRGDDNPAYRYRERDGKMCCLGIYLQACGLSAENLSGRHQPADVKDKILTGCERRKQDFSWLFKQPGNTHDGKGSKRVMDLVEANDSALTDGPSRESQVENLFAEEGIEVTFVD